jgi:long-subunit acyl-CoA synthetase (AMP-forming)
MQSGKAVFNISAGDVSKTVTQAISSIRLKYVVFDETTFTSNKHWITTNGEIKDSFVLTACGTRQIIRIVVFNNMSSSCLIGNDLESPKPFEYAYVMQTTGTTGKRKTVLVPHEAIVPNIEDFIEELWKCTNVDMIFARQVENVSENQSFKALCTFT